MKAKLKVGQKVRVRKDLEEGKRYFTEGKVKDDIVMDTMMWFAGKEVTIGRIVTMYDGEVIKYKLEGDSYGWNWTYEMFEPLKESKNTVVTRKSNNELFWTLDNIADEVLPIKYTLNKVIYSDTAVVMFVREIDTDKISKVVAKCHPEDTFDLETGVKVAGLKFTRNWVDKQLKAV